MSVHSTEYPVVWLPTAACTGCLVSVINSVSPSIRNVLVDEVVPGKHLNMRFNPTIMAGQGDPAMEVLDDAVENLKGQYVLVVDGAVPTAENGGYGVLGERDEVPVTMAEHVRTLGQNALAIVAIGTCASYGGIPSGTPNPTGCMGVKAFLDAEGIEVPVVNVPGCPPHPDWFLGTIASVLLYGLPGPDDLDEVGRPKAFYGELIHDNCPRRAFFDVGLFAEKLSDPGCLLKVGCKGYVTYADCPNRKWNSGVNWCIGSGGLCIGCVEPEFPDVMSPMYEAMKEGTIPAIRRDPETGKLGAGTWEG